VWVSSKLLTIGDLELTDDAATDEISWKHIIKKRCIYY
jgi:hypothetical protein